MRLNVELNKVEGEKLVKKLKKDDINKSDFSRGMFRIGYSVKEISEFGILYNMVYNIVSKDIMRNDLEDLVVKEEKEKLIDRIEKFIIENNVKEKKVVVKNFVKLGSGESSVRGLIKKLEIEKGIKLR